MIGAATCFVMMGPSGTAIIRKKMLTASESSPFKPISENDYINGYFFARFLN
jgi:hypothetical protein